jgi:speckle-type POZ protein
MKVEGEVEDGGAESMWLQQLLRAADRYNLPRLKSMCEQQLAKHINLSSVMTLLVLATQRYCDELKEACLEFLNVQSATALKGVMSTSDWENMSLAQRYVINMLSAKFASKM